MCSVVGCDSGRRNAQRFKLPEDPERRLEWVQFLATANMQRFKEASWTDIRICSEHFTDDCFNNMSPSQSGFTGRDQLTLNPNAVPSLCLKSESEEPETSLQSPTRAEPEETTEVAYQRDQLKICDGPTSFSEESRLTSTASEGSPVPRGVSSSTDSSDGFYISVYRQMQPTNTNFDLMKEKASLLQMKGKYVINEKRLLKMFSHKCPSCGSKVRMEKVTRGVLIILNQQCLQCDYSNQWKSQVNASVPTAEDQQLTEVVEVDLTPETQQAASTDNPSIITEVPEIVAVIDDKSDAMDETGESCDQGDSDEDWRPKNLVLDKMHKNNHDDKTKEKEDYGYPPLISKHGQLCTECGKFFNKQRPHTCEHIIKPYSCNICGKRCVSKFTLNTHSRIHSENYEHRCKYCYVTFKTKVDKFSHEQIHLIEGKPYKCPDCSETFAKNKERRIHLEDHRGPPQLKCNFCGIEFLWPLTLQRHLAVHTGEKPFKCSVCQRGFNQPSHLKSHMRLHTGERPFKCQHCDKSFNHNVSLKSHVQRYHSSNSGRERKTEKINKRESEAGDVQDGGSNGVAESGLDNVEEEDDTEEEEGMYRPKKKRKSTGRPIGRPKSYESRNFVEGQCSNTKTGNLQECGDEESQCEPRYRDTSFDSAEAIKNTARSRGRVKHPNCDSNFDPEEKKNKRYSSQSRGNSSGKRRGRPRKNRKQ
ncbi:myoneurin [Etheostoma spectabile]|uniref:myoneurin n=1 Tax=Etheostoma spectabile TaxID=54343 RepID=UPI0013AF8953|nr:myoneurin-like [Etheostoma spectabile]